MQPPFGIDSDLQTLFLNQANQGLDQGFPFIGLVHYLHRFFEIIGGAGRHPLHFGAFDKTHLLGRPFHQLQALVTLTDLLQGLPVGGIADEQTQLLYPGQAGGNTLQSRQKEIAHRKGGRLRGVEDAVNVID